MNDRKKNRITYVASERGLERAMKALQKDFQGLQKNLVDKCSAPDPGVDSVGRSTISNFFNQKPIECKSFIIICNALKLSNWKEIAGLEEDSITPIKVTENSLSADDRVNNKEEKLRDFDSLRKNHPNKKSNNSKKQPQQSPGVAHQPLSSGIYTVECLGDRRKPGEHFFLDGITHDGQIRLARQVNKNYSGTIWKIIYDQDKCIYRLKCLGRRKGARFLNAKTSERRLTLVPSAEDIGAKDEYLETKWEAFPVPDEPHTFRFNCYGFKEEPFYLDGRTLDSTVGLLEQADVGRSGTRWKVERVSEEVLKKVGLKNLESMPRSR